MDPITLLSITLVVLAVLAVFYFNQKFRKLEELQGKDEAQKVLTEWLKNMQASVDRTSTTINQRLDKAADVIGGVQKELGTMNEMGKMMKGLQEFLQSPKFRGGLGERVLTDTLSQTLPRSQFDTQYRFKDGSMVDAIVKTDRGLIPIDAKFPMENFKRMIRADSEGEKESHRRVFVRDVKKHIDAISRKYILPAEGTINFAMMYIPSEAVYYEVAVQNEELDDYAYQRKVIFVSPNIFTYFLQVLLLGLQEKKVAEGAREILEVLDGIRQESSKFGEELSVLSGHITRSKNAMDSVALRYQALARGLDSVRMLKADKGSEERGSDSA